MSSTAMDKDIPKFPTIKVDYLNCFIPAFNMDEWYSIEIDNKTYDVHYCLEYNTITVYEFIPELDSVTHRYKILATQKIK